MKKVYVLMEIQNMSDCVNGHGESAGDKERIVAVYSSFEAASDEKMKYDDIMEQISHECDCDDVRYRVDEWEVK